MSDAIQRVVDRLSELGFEIQHGAFRPFDEELPLVKTVAWDSRTAQLALIAEMSAADSDDVWRQLLFGASGLRHQLAGDGPSAFGTPVVLAVVDDLGVRRLRRLTEQLSERYALFNRVDLNLVPDTATQSVEALDDALAPLLPRCRSIEGQAISRADVLRFWSDLRAEIETTALASADHLFRPYAVAAAEAAADALIGDVAESDELPAPEPARSLHLRNFRSFVDQEVTFEPAMVIHGPNGGGKTSVVEALELGWARHSHRQPHGVEPTEYARHLDRDGEESFQLSLDGVTITEVNARPAAELSRSVLGQDALGELVSRTPAERYAALLTVTGLEIPDLAERTERLLRAAKAEADTALVEAGLPPLRQINSVALSHLRKHLAGGFADRLTPTQELIALERAVAATCEGQYKARAWDDDALVAALSGLDVLIAATLAEDHDARGIADALDDTAAIARSLARPRQDAASAADALATALQQRFTEHSAPTAGPPPDAPEGLPANLAVRWLSHANSLTEGAARFRDDATSLDRSWQVELLEYAAALEHTATLAPRDRLGAAISALPPAPAVPAAGIDERLYHRAGFRGPVSDPRRIAEPLHALATELQRHAEALFSLAEDLDRHPARDFAEHAPRVLRALCRFDVAKSIRRDGPVLRAAERLLDDLLQGRLAPILRELAAAIVRFEWYFKPLQLSTDGRQIVIGGLGTSQADLDARLILNAAERTVVGVAWFLALHLLQPPDRRRVLVLDDPTAAFDLTNQAGFISTLRAFARLLQPKQIVMTTYDDVLAAILAEELAPVDGWPASVGRVCCRRNEADASVARRMWTHATSRTIEDECRRLGLGGAKLADHR